MNSQAYWREMGYSMYPRLTQGKVAIWKKDVQMAHARPWGMFVLLDSKRY